MPVQREIWIDAPIGRAAVMSLITLLSWGAEGSNGDRLNVPERLRLMVCAGRDDEISTMPVADPRPGSRLDTAPALGQSVWLSSIRTVGE